MEILDFTQLKEEIARMCEELAAGGVPESAVFSSRVVAHELLTNALSYGGGRAQLSYVRTGDEIHISVRAQMEFCPPETVARADLYAEHGRGLYLVDALSEKRQYSREEGVSVVIVIKG